MAFADNLRRLRTEQFLSQAELARRAGLQGLTITRLEAGVTAPATRTVRALAEVLGVEPGELAMPEEVAELRRVLGQVRHVAGEAGERLDHWNDDGGAGSHDQALTEQSRGRLDAGAITGPRGAGSPAATRGLPQGRGVEPT